LRANDAGGIVLVTAGEPHDEEQHREERETADEEPGAHAI
jgi:hypothetical protein